MCIVSAARKWSVIRSVVGEERQAVCAEDASCTNIQTARLMSSTMSANGAGLARSPLHHNHAPAGTLRLEAGAMHEPGWQRAIRRRVSTLWILPELGKQIWVLLKLGSLLCRSLACSLMLITRARFYR